MNIERAKSWVLVFLVSMSIVLTIQLWLDIPVQRIISYSKPATGQDSNKDYNLSNFLFPRWIIVNFGGRSHTKVFQNSELYKFYNEIYNKTLEVMEALPDNQQVALTRVTDKEWIDAKLSKSVEVQFEYLVSSQLVQKVFKLDGRLDFTPLEGIKEIVITVTSDSYLYIKGISKGQVVTYRTPLPPVVGSLAEVIDRLEEKDPVKYWTFQDMIDPSGGKDSSKDYTVYLPLEMSSFNLPVGLIVKELDVNNKQAVEMFAANFFEDMSIVRRITETSGSVIFTDGHSALKMDTRGYAEYLVYNANSDQKDLITIDQAFKKALQFIDSHGGIPEQLYLARAEEIIDNQQRGYLFRFNYCYNGLPFVVGADTEQYTLEVTIFNNTVTGYKRMVYRTARSFIVQDTLLDPIEAINIVFPLAYYGSGETRQQALDAYLEGILDMHLAYSITPIGNRGEGQAIPVWYIKRQDVTYMIDAYKGMLLNY